MRVIFRPRWGGIRQATQRVPSRFRTRRRFYQSRPGRLLVALTAAMMGLALVVPYLPGAKAIGFVPLPSGALLVVIGIAVAYSLATEWHGRS